MGDNIGDDAFKTTASTNQILANPSDFQIIYRQEGDFLALVTL